MCAHPQRLPVPSQAARPGGAELPTAPLQVWGCTRGLDRLRARPDHQHLGEGMSAGMEACPRHCQCRPHPRPPVRGAGPFLTLRCCGLRRCGAS
eukprot:736529-Rhodomonas_salina.1